MAGLRGHGRGGSGMGTAEADTRADAGAGVGGRAAAEGGGAADAKAGGPAAAAGLFDAAPAGTVNVKAAGVPARDACEAEPGTGSFEAVPDEAGSGSPLLRQVASLVVAALLFLGTTASMSAACGLDASVANIVSGCIVAAVVALLAVRADGGRYDSRFAIGLAVAIVAVTVVGWPAVSGGGTQVLNGFIYVLGTMSQEYALPYISGSASELAIFCAVASAAIAYLCVQLAMHGNIPVVFIAALALCVLMALDLVPASGWTVVLAVGLVGALCIGGGSRCDFRSARSIVSSLGISVVIVAVAIAISFSAFGAGPVDTSDARAALRNLACYVRYGGSSYAMPLGELEDLGALDVSERPALEIETDGEAVEYLRGFVGEVYDGSSWDSLDGEDVTDSQGLFYWLSEDGFDTVSQIADAAAEAGFEDDGEQEMTISYVGARGGYAYLPYAYVSGGELSMATDLSTVSTDEDSLQVVASGSLLRESYLVQDELEDVQEELGDSSSAYLDDEGAYREFVYENYLDVPDDVAQTLEELFGEAETLDTEQAKAVVESELEEQVSYDDTIETDCGDEDFAIYFLTESRAGYSVHYATAATLMLRYYGVPARYVEGYVLDTSGYADDVEGEVAGTDGGAAGEDPSVSTYELTEGDAHAWVEYYLDGVGWIPFDVTPGFGDQDFYEPTGDSVVQDSASRWSVGDSEGDSPVSDSDEEEGEEEEEESLGTVAVTRFDEFRFMILWSLLGLVVVLLAALVVRTIVKRRNLARFLAGLAGGSPGDAVADGFAYGIYLGEKCLKIRFDNRPYREQGEVAESGRLCGAATFEAAADANSRALFSEDAGAVDEDDREAVLAFVEESRAGVRGNVSLPRKLWQRLILCIW